MSSLESLLQALTTKRDLVIEYETDMTSLRGLGPENGGDGEWEKGYYLERIMRQIGLFPFRIDTPDDRVLRKIRPNIAAKVIGKSKSFLWIVAHMDLVPPGDLSLWNTDPWQVAVDGDQIIGRGVLDNQQAIVCGLLLAEEIIEQRIMPDIGLALLFVSDEETGNRYGIDTVLKNRPDIFGEEDMVLAPDIGLPDGSAIEVAEKTQYWLKITVTGVQSHASCPDEGKNTLIAAADMILHLSDIAECFPQKHELFLPPYSTFAPTRYEENVPNINTISGRDIFYIDCRLLPEINPDDVLTKFYSVFEKVAQNHGVSVAIDVVQQSPISPITSPESNIVKRLKSGIRRIYNLEPHCYGVGGGTIAATFRRHGFPAAAWASLPCTAHVANEFTLISKIISDTQVMATMLFN